MATAVIRTGAKQYRVAAGDVIQIEKLVGSPGDDVVFSRAVDVVDHGAHRLQVQATQELP